MDDTRMIFVGDAALATGFRLAGFEVLADAGQAELDALLQRLQATRAHAFVVIDQALAECDSKALAEVRREGGRILLTQVPPLTDPDAMHSAVDDHIRRLLDGEGA